MKNCVLTPVRQCLPSRKSITGDKLSDFDDSKEIFDVGDVAGADEVSSFAFSDRAAATTLLIFGKRSLLIISDFNVPS